MKAQRGLVSPGFHKEVLQPKAVNNLAKSETSLCDGDRVRVTYLVLSAAVLSLIVNVCGRVLVFVIESVVEIYRFHHQATFKHLPHILQKLTVAVRLALNLGPFQGN